MGTSTFGKPADLNEHDVFGQARPPIQQSTVNNQLPARRDRNYVSATRAFPIVDDVQVTGRKKPDEVETIEVSRWSLALLKQAILGYKVISKKKRPRHTVFGRIAYNTIYIMQREAK